MSDTNTATPPATAATSTPRRTAARPTVSVRPAAVGAVNAATIAGATIVAAGGGAILAVAAGGAALAATAAGARKTGQAKAARQAGGGLRVPAGGGGGRSGGGSRAARAAASPGSKASGSGRPSAGSRSGGKSSGGALLPKSSSGGRGSGPGSSGRGRSGAGGGTAGKGGARTTGHRRAGSNPGSGSRSPLTADKVAAARRKLANRRQPGPRLSDAIRSATTPNPAGKKPTAREAFGTARRTVTGDTPKNRGPLRRATAGLIAGGLAAGKAAYDSRQRRRKRDAARQAKNDRVAARRGPQVGTTVRRPAGATDPNSKQRKPAPLPLRAQPGPFKGTILVPHSATCARCNGPILKDEWAYPIGGGALIGPCCGCNFTVNDQSTPTDTRKGLITMTHPLLAISEDFLAAATRNQPEGMLQVTAEAHTMAEVMDNLLTAMKIRFDRAQEHPVHPSIKEMYGLVHKAQMAVQQAAAEIGPSIEKVHEKELDRLRNPRTGEAMWDVARNRGAA